MSITNLEQLSQNSPYQEAASMQLKIDRDFAYIEDRNKVFPDIANGQFVPITQIRSKGIGNCNEGFILAASGLLELGYDVSGLCVMPQDTATNQTGHIIAVYAGREIQGTNPNKLGTAGVSAADFMIPVFDSLEEIATAMALKHGWTTATWTELGIDPLLIQGTEYFTLNATRSGAVDLRTSYGVSFATESTGFGEINYELYKDGFAIRLSGTLLTGLLANGPVTCLSANSYSNKDNARNVQVVVDYRTKVEGGSLYLFYDEIQEGALTPRTIMFYNPVPDSMYNPHKIYSSQEDGSYRDSDTGDIKPAEKAAAYFCLGDRVMKMLGFRQVNEYFHKGGKDIRDLANESSDLLEI